MQETDKLVLCRSDLLLLQCFQSYKKKQTKTDKQKHIPQIETRKFILCFRSEYFPISKIC